MKRTDHEVKVVAVVVTVAVAVAVAVVVAVAVAVVVPWCMRGQHLLQSCCNHCVGCFKRQ